MSEESIKVRIKLEDAAKFIAETKAAGHEIEILGNKTERSGRQAKSSASSFDLVTKSLKQLRPALAVASIGVLGQVMASSAGGAVALGGALAPLVGLLGALPAVGAAGAQGLAVLALAFTGVSAAVGGLNAQMDPKKFMMLSAPAQNFALTLDGLKGRVHGLQSAVQAGLFPGLTRGLVDAAPALDALKGPLTGTGRVFGLLGERLGRLVGSRGFLKDLRDQAYFNNIQFTRLGAAGLHVVNILRNLAVASRPLVSWMVRLVSGWAAAADHATTLGRSSGGLARMFHSVQVTTSRVVRIVADLAVALFNIGKVGKQSIGDSLLVSLVRGADALRKWTDSSAGVQKITGFFADAKPVIYATARLLGDVATQLLRFGSGADGGLVGTLNTFDSMVKVLGQLSSLVGPDTVIYAFLGGKLLGGGLKALRAFDGLLGGLGGKGVGRVVGFSVIRAGVLEVGVIKSGAGGLPGTGPGLPGPNKKEEESALQRVMRSVKNLLPAPAAAVLARSPAAAGVAAATALTATGIGIDLAHPFRAPKSIPDRYQAPGGTYQTEGPQTPLPPVSQLRRPVIRAADVRHIIDGHSLGSAPPSPAAPIHLHVDVDGKTIATVVADQALRNRDRG